ncbi:MAG: P-II family nitrogen regulator [Burkholderiales bacterium]|nr:P-II family nitrogen regulator [Burkholderiales bacterium]
MDFKLIIAIIRVDKLEEVEKKLREIGVERINISKVKGYGDYQDFFARNWMVEEVRLEVFTRREEAEAISAAIMEAAHTGLPGDGVVAVMPIEKLFLVRTKGEATPDEFRPLR